MSEIWKFGIFTAVAFLVIATLFDIKKAQQEHNTKVNEHLQRITELLRYIANIRD